MGIRVISVDNHTWRIENEFVRFFLLEGSRNALLIDSGATCPDAREIAQGLTQKPIRLLNTHGDGDHTSGNGSFPEFFMHPDDYRNCGAAEKYPDAALLPLSDGQQIDLGDRILEIITIPGHTCGSVAVLDASSRRTLYSGDSVQTGDIFLFGSHRCPERFAAALEKIISMRDRFDRIFPSHGEAVLNTDAAEKVLEGWNAVCNGEVQPNRIDLFGNAVDHYRTSFCGFYCNPAE